MLIRLIISHIPLVLVFNNFLHSFINHIPTYSYTEHSNAGAVHVDIHIFVIARYSLSLV